MEETILHDKGIREILGATVAAEIFLDDRDPKKQRENLGIANRVMGNDARPNYAIVDPVTEEVLSRIGFTREKSSYENFLKKGLGAFAARRGR